ncbi:hypothetical protein RRX38_00785 [Pseudomonas sp. DTU_2021_1001937_2_SI_NGA_ILE_001]|uniref:hypothetical protein n=1 Tax=Pseudomonas sp. DTU_2021_1001937_2_SI_NGA_ILE_001 TaxID=3077589 RepID=UPI0028FC1FBC|nr:hypothetical protein [Pseudomonas sp. DTU_2021_1001937_2_SI_NGA_ILE_001]WNW09739.1 hypothetical protein RRX38_00785 [Pseudomonas sp. DTU_2021_1001937_2_SI_NGA_ILE_001]
MILDKPTPDAFEVSHEVQALPTTPPALYSWSVKRINLPRASIWIWPIGLTIWPVLTIIIFRDLYTDFFITYAIFISGAILTCLCILSDALKRTDFNYRIHPEKGELDYRPRYFKHEGLVYKCVAAAGLLVLLAVAAYTESIIFILGAGGLILTALRLSSWEPPPTEYETSLPWHEYNYVTIDRYFLIIAVHVDEEQCGFEARLPNKELFEQYLAFLRTVLPPSAQYREGIWWG